jgi:hypothetical protein
LLKQASCFSSLDRLVRFFIIPVLFGARAKRFVSTACGGGKEKIIRFGQQGVSGAGKSPKTAKEKARKKSFKARHAKNISKGKMSAAYWADKVKW